MSVSLTVMTFNLHEDQPEDSPNSCLKRKDLCVSVITSYSPLIICTQQAEFWMLNNSWIIFSNVYQVMINSEYQEKDLKIYQMNTAPSSMTKRRDARRWNLFGCLSHLLSLEAKRGVLKFHLLQLGQFQLKGVEPPGFSFQVVNTNMDEFSPRAYRRSALLTWQHIASLPPSLAVTYCGGFNTQKESTTGRFLLGRSRERGVIGDMRDAWPSARVRKNVSLIQTYHRFKGNKQGTLEFLKLFFRALCLCWDRHTQDLQIDWIPFRGRSLIPVLCEVLSDNIDRYYPSSHYPIFTEFMLPCSVRMIEPPLSSSTTQAET